MMATDELRKKVLRELEKQVPKFAEQVAPLYKQLEWGWGWNPVRIPTVKEIEECLKELIEGQIKENEPSWATGGLCVSITNRDGHITGVVSFTCDFHVWATPDGNISTETLKGNQ